MASAELETALRASTVLKFAMLPGPGHVPMIEEDEMYFAVFPQGSIWCGANSLAVHIVIADLGIASIEESVLAGLTFSCVTPSCRSKTAESREEVKARLQMTRGNGL
jgi:hypothetical protein